MGFQPFFRKPQLHRPCLPPPHQFLNRHRRATSFPQDRPQHHSRRVQTPPAAEPPAPPVNPPLLPLAGHLVSGLFVFVSFLILMMLVMVR